MSRTTLPALSVVSAVALAALTGCGSSGPDAQEVARSAAASAAASVSSAAAAASSSAAAAAASSSDAASSAASASESATDAATSPTASETTTDATTDAATTAGASSSAAAPAADPGPAPKGALWPANATNLPATVGDLQLMPGSAGGFAMYKKGVSGTVGVGTKPLTSPYQTWVDLLDKPVPAGTGVCGAKKSYAKSFVCYMQAEGGVVVINTDDHAMTLPELVAFTNQLTKAVGAR